MAMFEMLASWEIRNLGLLGIYDFFTWVFYVSIWTVYILNLISKLDLKSQELMSNLELWFVNTNTIPSTLDYFYFFV